MTVLLEAAAITLRRDSRTVVQPVDLRVRAGELCALLGPNGAGKTTILSMLVGLLPPGDGRVAVAGIDLREPAARALVGFAPDDLPMPAALTGEELLRLHDRLRQRDDRERAAALCRLLEIEHALPRQIAEYSHGMRRKLQLVAAMMHEPLVLVLDEPDRGLDPRSARLLWRLLDGITDSGRAVLIATHDLGRAERDADRLWLIHRGAVVADGTPADVRSAGCAPDLDTALAALTGSAGERERDDALLRAAIYGERTAAS